MIKLLFVISGLSTGGAENMMIKLLDRFDRERFDITVISLTSGGELADRVTRQGIPLYQLNMAFGISGLFAFYELFKLIRKIKPDVVQTWMYHADLLGGVAARLCGINKIVWGIRNSNLDPVTTSRATRGVVRICSLISHAVPKAIISCSNKALEVHARLGYDRAKMFVIANGFDLEEFHPDGSSAKHFRTRLGLSDQSIVIGIVGRFDPQKDHQGFFKAVSIVANLFPEIQIVALGKGVDESNRTLMNFVENNNLQSKTHLLGLRSDVHKIMPAFDVYVSASAYGEAFPNVLGEAMASGVPCVTTDVGDSSWIVGDAGLSVEPRNPDELAAAIIKILRLSNDERMLMGKKGRERVLRFFEIKNIVREYEQYYETTMDLHN